MNEYPIWRNVYAVDSSDNAEVEVLVDGVVVYNGRMAIAPDEDEWTFSPNDIVRDYVKSTYPSLTGGGTSLNVKAPVVQVRSNGDTILEVRFIPDWCYDPAHSIYSTSAPIDYIIDPRMVLPYTFITEYGSTKVVTAKVTHEGGVATVSSSDVNAGTFGVDLSQYTNPTEVEIDGLTYKVESTCQRYALIYLNAYGGWDTYVPKGSQKRKDSYTRSTIAHIANTAVYRSRGRECYNNKVVTSWTLNTGLLTDEASLRMHHLLGSPSVYMHDLEEGVIYAVTIKNNMADYLTAKTNGRQFPTVDIEVEFAQDRMRR